MKLAYKLKHRIQIRKSVQTPNEETGGFDQSYEILATIWAALQEGTKGGMEEFVKYIRGETVASDIPTHTFIVRKVAVQNFGRELSIAFDSAFKQMPDLINLKSDYYIFMQAGSSVKGRSFKIMTLRQDENYNEYIKIRAMEVEEMGTGYPI
jgi:hypothetical protein